jgi:polyisoprenoid-binding protein YceI
MMALSISLVVQAEIKSSQQSGSVTFAGQHAGMDFKGKFERWQARLNLPPQSNPSITATFYLNSAKTGDSIYDSTLPEFDWFDSQNHPKGEFVSSKIDTTDNGYQVSGNLTLKGITAPVDFVLKETNNKLTANFDINRLDFNIGTESDSEAEWVSKTISLSILINK